jgi:hypothetical protein
MHYFRIPREYWRDRLTKLKECGFNTVETYTCWNLHEPQEGVFDFSGMLDLDEYLRVATELGLYIILRPGPYICAEWDLGGLPAWLLTYEGMALRCMDELYLSKVRRYYTELLTRIRHHFSGSITNCNYISASISCSANCFFQEVCFGTGCVDCNEFNIRNFFFCVRNQFFNKL